MARSNQVVAFKQEGNIQTYTVGGQAISFDIEKVSLAVQTQAMYHGFKQRISDKAAIARDTKTGQPATPQDKFNAIKAIIEHYETGTDKWDLTRAGGGQRRTEASYVIEALALIQDVSVEDMEARVTQMAEKREVTVEAYLRKVATSDAVAKKVAELKHGESDDADDILDELAAFEPTDDQDESTEETSE